MIEFITQYKTIVIIAVIALLLFNNRESLGSLISWTLKTIGFIIGAFKFDKVDKRATQDDRKNLYECLIQLQDYLAICGVDRKEMDSMTLSKVGELTVSATTPLKVSLKKAAPINGMTTDPDTKLLDGV